MSTKAEFLKIMSEQTEIALATSVNNVPNVRIVNFYFDPEENVLYFSSFKENDKIKEIKANPHVAFTTIPHSGNEHVKAKGIVQKSSKTILTSQINLLLRFQTTKILSNMQGNPWFYLK